MSADLEEIIQQYTSWDPNRESRNDILKLHKAQDTKALVELLMQRLAFGTAGLRGPMGAGYNCMNDLVVLQTTQGVIKYMESIYGESAKAMGIVIGYDHRRQNSLSSLGFARMCAAVLLSQGYKVFALEGLVATPFVPFAVTHLHCAAGIMVTASHNPKEDNGLKVYWSNGSQIIPPHDEGIAAAIEANLQPWMVYNTTEDHIVAHANFHDVTAAISSAYFSSIQLLSVPAALPAHPLRIAYTAMHGVGFKWIERAFQETTSINGLPSCLPVPCQQDPDPEFPTVRFPNPEEAGALDEAIAFANGHDCDVILANDPDADRLAVAERVKGEWKVFSGNEIGVLLGHCQIQKHLASAPSPDQKAAVLTTVVSSRMLKAIADKEGIHYAATLTGFKWIGNRARELQQEGFKVLFLYEEALGYCVGDVVVDKDGISAAVAMAELANNLAMEGLTLTSQLAALHAKYGLYVSYNTYLFVPDPAVTSLIFERLRGDGSAASYWSSTAGSRVVRVTDVTCGYDSGADDGVSALPRTPDAQMIMFEFANNCCITLRASGTEPKLKCYSELVSEPGNGRSEAELLESLQCFVEACIEEMLQPELNKLKRA